VSRAVPHFVRIVDAPGQPPRAEQCASKTEALEFGRRVASVTFRGAVVSVYEGTPTDNVERDPVKVWS
jgi:hypothetical protein